MKKLDHPFDQHYLDNHYGFESQYEIDESEVYRAVKGVPITHEQKFHLFEKIEHDINSIVRMYTQEQEDDDEFEGEIEQSGHYKPDQAKAHRNFLRLQKYQFFVGEIACVLEFSLRYLSGLDVHGVIRKVNDAILDHPFTRSDADLALLHVERHIPLTYDLYTGVIKRVSVDTDNRMIRHFIKNGDAEFDDVVKLISVYAAKQSFEALAVCFNFWLREKPFDPFCHREEIGEMGWHIILSSHAYTGLFLNPALDRFINRFEEQLSSALPLMTKHRSTLRDLPSYGFTAALKASGYTDLALAIGTRLRDIHDEHIQGKFKALKSQGVEISEVFIKDHLSSARSIPGWTMAMEYYLQDDDMHFELEDLCLPGIQPKKFDYERFLISRQMLVRLLDKSFPSEQQDEKSMALARYYTANNPVLIKELLEGGLPDRYLAVEHIREEKLFLDLGL
jgi:hypothetical protein